MHQVSFYYTDKYCMWMKMHSGLIRSINILNPTIAYRMC